MNYPVIQALKNPTTTLAIPAGASPMKIGELVKQTGVPKETIHFYIREGLLRKPRKSASNIADYTRLHVEQILLVKELRENYYLPIPEIKKVLRQLKKQSPAEQAVSQFHHRYFRPLDRLLISEIRGADAFREATGLGRKWLDKMERWGIIACRLRDGERIYSQDDVIIGRLIVDMDRLGFGPKDGYNPEDLKQVADFIRDYVASGQNRYLKTHLDQVAAGEIREGASRINEVMSLFFYHMYRKLVREKQAAAETERGNHDAHGPS
jgi:DNA-binding transcriptional MerR regulator